MSIFNTNKLHVVHVLLFTLLCLTLSQNLWAARAAIVVADKAVIYADDQQSAPVGYVRKGKKISIGESPKNRPEVYPVVVSGKIAYIRVVDVSTERQSVDPTALVAERFRKAAETPLKYNYTLSYFNYSSQIGLNASNTGLEDGDSLNWHGLSLKGGTLINTLWDVEILMNFMNGKGEKEVFRAVEFGVGAALRVFEKGDFKAKLFGQFLAVPFSSYSFGEELRVNGYGFGTGAGANVIYKIGRNFGVEGFLGLYYTKLSGFKPPPPFHEIDPTFMGTRMGVGINYQY